MSTTEKRLRAAERSGDGVAVLRERWRAGAYATLLVSCGSCDDAEWAEVLRDRRACCNGTGKREFLWQDRLSLAAYCGDAGAREVCGSPNWDCAPCSLSLEDDIRADWICVDENPFGDWLKGLERWPREVLIRAAVAGARVAFERRRTTCPACRFLRNALPSPCSGCLTLLGAIEAVEAWLVDPSDGNLGVCRDDLSPGLTGLWFHLLYVVFGGGGARVASGREACMDAARVATEPAVRAAICAALIAWALS